MAMPEFTTFAFVVCAAAVLLAGLVRGFAGFGSAMIMMPALALFHGPQMAVPVALLLEVALALPFVPSVAKQIDWRRIGLLAGCGMLATPLGVWLLHVVPEAAMRWVISLVILGFVAMLAFGWRCRGRPAPWATALTGVASGALNGATGMGGPPVVFYFLAGQDESSTVRASVVAHFAAIDLASLAIFALVGALDRPALLLALWMLPAYLVGAWLGARLFGLASEAFYRRLALILLAVIAAASVLAE
jgi:uncharacterized membrane protein YfcA